ncbi:Mitochondrial import receptor subunit TOM22 like protein [Myotis davidii]|uniref:Mitochondrial import receptor subunit TOM22 homolog n=1 Tax=Myotis davidii TaxID=225400 RepID=L5MJP7_MYODS|nr:Mitochondrial import receptor subunit TOM22 like protein [Myotis davidii]
MAAIVAAPGPGAPLPPDELLPKGDAEKTEEELEEDDDDEVLGPSGRGGERGFSRAALWIGTTSFMILVLPVVFETEKLQMEQQQQLQQRQILLGPNTGLSGGMPGALPSLPGKI